MMRVPPNLRLCGVGRQERVLTQMKEGDAR